MRWLTVLLVLTLTVAGCGGGSKQASGGSKYPANVETNFLNSCEANGGDVNSCGCALTWLENHVSLTQVMADEDEVASGGHPADLDRAIAACP